MRVVEEEQHAIIASVSQTLSLLQIRIQLACQLIWQSAAPVSQRSWVQIPCGPEFFQVLFSTTSSVVFLAARISQIRLFTAVQIYKFHISKIIIHHFDGLFGPNILTSSQWACQLSWQSAALVSQRSWFQTTCGPEFFSSPIFNYQFSSVLACEDLLNSNPHVLTI